MKECKWTTEKALSFVKEKRLSVNPNLGFKKQLKQLEFELGLITKEQLKMDLYNLTPPWERLNNSSYLKSIENNN
jgi:hypothetical protein